MGSFDVKSLFINIPFRETIDLCVENLYRNQTRIYSLTKSSFRRFFIYYIEKIICLENSPTHFKPVVYRRCVDDIFLLSNFLHLNKQHKNVVFTYSNEKKKNGSLSFLDIKISHANNKFITSVYQKPTISRAFTSFESFISKSYKYGKNVDKNKRY